MGIICGNDVVDTGFAVVREGIRPKGGPELLNPFHQRARNFLPLGIAPHPECRDGFCVIVDHVHHRVTVTRPDESCSNGASELRPHTDLNTPSIGHCHHQW